MPEGGSSNRFSVFQPGSTAPSWLERLRAGEPDAWRRFVDVYGPLVYVWCRRRGLRAEDSADILQEVCRAVAVHSPRFERLETGAFRKWLYVLSQSKLADWQRQRIRHPGAPGGSEFRKRLESVPEMREESSSVELPADDRRIVLRLLVDRLRKEYSERTWTAFDLSVLRGLPVSEVASRLQMTPENIRKIKSRLLGRLRRELQAAGEE